MTTRSTTLLGLAALTGLVLAGCSDSVTGPTRFSPTQALASGGSGSGGGSIGGGGGGTGGSGGSGGTGGNSASIPQVAGTWRGQEHYDPSLSAFFLPGFMDPPMSLTIVEDATGTLTGLDNIMGIAITGKASTNGSIVIQDGSYYGQKITVDLTGSVACSDGSTGTVMSGKFQRKEGFGTISLDNCPVTQP
jgi:hypothetical protein